MNAALLFITKYRKEILYVLIALILFLVIRKNWHRIKRAFQPRDINYEAGEAPVPNTERQKYLETLAGKLKSDIYDTPVGGHDLQLYKEANQLSDSELLYLSRYYKRHLTQGNTLYQDVDDEVFNLFTSVDQELMDHLSKIGER